jgi:hypothetical protein
VADVPGAGHVEITLEDFRSCLRPYGHLLGTADHDPHRLSSLGEPACCF